MKYATLLFALAVYCLAQPSKGFDGKPFNTDDRIATFEKWLKADPANVQNSTLLAAAYIQKTRETNDYGYLDRASKLVDRVLVAQRDYEALRLRNLIELTRHHFAAVVEYSREMTKSAPSDPQNWGSLGDALMEMGEHEEARQSYEKMLTLRRNLFSLNRMAHYRFVTGDTAGAIAMMSEAVKAGAQFPENQAWCLVELGTLYFKTGKWSDAERAYLDAITAFPTAHAAYAGLGAVQAAQGKPDEAIASYRKAQSMTPMIQYAGALYDLYQLKGNRTEMANQAALVDVVAQLEAASGQKANRTLALIYANQGRRLKEALESAEADFQVRHDVYTSDALAWALHRQGRNEEARKASTAALRLGTPEAMFHYHAGAIALALGDSETAREQMKKALALNPAFDLRFAAEARKVIATHQ